MFNVRLFFLNFTATTNVAAGERVITTKTTTIKG